MIEHGSKKSESIEVRLSHGDKQAFMSKASFEADLQKLEREKGGKVLMFKKGPDGKLVKVEMK